MHVNFIRDGQGWMDRLGSLKLDAPQPLTVPALSKALNQEVRQCRFWRSNWRNRIYKVELVDGTTVIAKQMFVPTLGEMANCDRVKLQNDVGLPGVRVPRPLAYLEPERTFVMEFLPGRTLKALFWEPAGWPDLPAASQCAGKMLGRLHAAWTKSIQPVPVEDLAEDLAAIPGGLKPREQQTLQAALDAVAGQQVALGPVYQDFKPTNVIYHGGEVALIDPPELMREGILLWDVSTFRRYLRWQLVKNRVLRFWRRPPVKESLARFESGYAEAYPKSQVMPDFSPPLLFLILELQQVGQLMVLQRGKLRLAKVNSGLLRMNRRWTGEVVASTLSLPLLRRQKRRIIRQMRCALTSENSLLTDDPQGALQRVQL